MNRKPKRSGLWNLATLQNLRLQFVSCLLCMWFPKSTIVTANSAQKRSAMKALPILAAWSRVASQTCKKKRLAPQCEQDSPFYLVKLRSCLKTRKDVLSYSSISLLKIASFFVKGSLGRKCPSYKQLSYLNKTLHQQYITSKWHHFKIILHSSDNVCQT